MAGGTCEANGLVDVLGMLGAVGMLDLGFMEQAVMLGMGAAAAGPQPMNVPAIRVPTPTKVAHRRAVRNAIDVSFRDPECTTAQAGSARPERIGAIWGLQCQEVPPSDGITAAHEARCLIKTAQGLYIRLAPRFRFRENRRFLASRAV
jgi:hypothetical protein